MDIKNFDQSLEDDKRRRRGAFYTPALFVNEAHRRISECLGENWKDEYVVWDCCCGTKNLTRDYKFKELYCSTIDQEELDISTDLNPESISFKFDFLNDPLENLPQGLINALEQNKPILFFINPPYGTSSTNKRGKAKAGIGATLVNKRMKEDKMGMCSANLYAQFLYNIILIIKRYKLSNYKLALFAPPLYLTGPSWKKFRTVFLKMFDYKNGMLFQASHFANVKGYWGISFSVWNNGESKDKNNFLFDLIGDNLPSDKNVYNIDGQMGNREWSIDRSVGKKYEVPNLTSGIKIKEETGWCNKLPLNSIGYMLERGNNVNENETGCAVFSSAYPNAGFPITPNNFTRSVTSHSIRKLIGCKNVYNTDSGNSAALWVREEVKGRKGFDCPQMKSGINWNPNPGNKKMVGRKIANSLGFFYNDSNNVDKNTQSVGLFSCPGIGGIGLNIIKENYNKCISLFSARKLIGCKNVYNTDSGNSAASWVREEVKGRKGFDCPQFSNGIKIKSEGRFLRGRTTENSVGYFYNDSNSVNRNNTGVSIFTSGFCGGEGLPVIKENYNKCISLFSARKLIGCKNVYNTDNNTPASSWVREEVKDKKTHKSPNMSNGINIKPSEKGRSVDNSLGYFYNSSNNVLKNLQEVGMFCSPFSAGNGIPIIKENYNKCNSLFSARKLILPNWVIDKDEYLKPNTEHPKYKEFENDSVVYSLFHSSSNQSSLRQIDYKDKKWDIKNEFFWLSKSEFEYPIIIDGEDRFVYKYLQNITLSKEAQDVLDYASMLVRKSIKYREEFDKKHPEYQIMNWDCGYYQLKALWKEYLPEEFKEFRKLFKILEDKMRPMVYELGFLK